MLPSFARESVTVERAPLVDSRGTKVRDWAHSVAAEVGGCNVQPVSSSVSWNDPAQAVTVRARLFAPPSADIQAGDRITYNGAQYAIDGNPHAWKSPTGAVDHIECALIDWRL